MKLDGSEDGIRGTGAIIVLSGQDLDIMAVG